MIQASLQNVWLLDFRGKKGVSGQFGKQVLKRLWFPFTSSEGPVPLPITSAWGEIDLISRETGGALPEYRIKHTHCYGF